MEICICEFICTFILCVNLILFQHLHVVYLCVEGNQCMHMYICTHTNMYVNTNMHISEFICTFILCVKLMLFQHLHVVYLCVEGNQCIHTCIYIYIYICKYVCKYEKTHLWIYVYVHTFCQLDTFPTSTCHLAFYKRGPKHTYLNIYTCKYVYK